jgi:UDP-N-acetylmuramoyl-tripeptide--D-alanyl-D-alanine ligase
MALRFAEDQILKATGAVRVRAGSRVSYEAVTTDSRKLEPECLFVALRGERFDGHAFVGQAAQGGAAGVLVERGAISWAQVPDPCAIYEVEDTLRALGALATFHRYRLKMPIGAVGGSNGKTTTKEMVAAILETRGQSLKTEGNLNNEIGVPLTLFRLDRRHAAAVLELGMNHPGEMTRLARMVDPDAAVITVIQPEHLEGLGSLEGVAEAEGELFRELRAEAVAVVNLDDPWLVKQAQGLQCKRLGFGRAVEADVRIAQVRPLGKDGLEVAFDVAGGTHWARLSFLGEHNALNAAAAFALAYALGYRPAECILGLEAARPYARRLNVLNAPGDLTVIDDCYNANPASMLAALDTAHQVAGAGRAVAVLGDMLELGPTELEEHAKVGEHARGKVALAAFYGPRSRAAQQAFGGEGAHFEELGPLLSWLRPRLAPGDVVLVKGSRGMRLERVVEALSAQGAGGAH